MTIPLQRVRTGLAKDMTGVRFGACVVERQAPTVNGMARWSCLCTVCGYRWVWEGLRIREVLRRKDKGTGYKCPECRKAGK